MSGSRHLALIETLEKLSTEVVSKMGLELVELSLRGSSKHRVVRVDLDRAGPRGIEIGDCRRASSELGDAFDRVELLDAGYTLEVSSPGLDRPILTADDFRRNTGRRVEIETNSPVNGTIHFVGVLLGLQNDRVRLRDDRSGVVEIELERIATTRQEAGI